MSFAPQPTTGDDLIIGDDASDQIDALAGNDTVLAGGGNDDVNGGPGDDDLQGQEGNDTLSANPLEGSDRLAGGPGDDLYLVGREATVIEAAGEGNDTIRFRDDTFTGTVVVPANVETLILVGRFNNLIAQGNDQDNAIYGNNTGDDTISGGGGNDYLQGDFAFFAGSNSFSGAAGDDVIHGGDGDDVIWGDQGPRGGSGNDVLYGDAGNDELHGQGGNNQLFGGEGDDRLDGGTLLSGGPGNDTYLFGRGSGSESIVETAVPGEANVVQFETGVLPSDVAVRREGDDLVFYIVGYLNNRLEVQDYFGAANAPITQAVFSDGTVWDAAVFGTAPPGPLGDEDLFIRGTPGTDFLAGRGGNDTIDGLAGDDNIEGGAGDDYLLGGPGRDNLLGGAGNDRLDGGVDNDSLFGGEGQDTLLGDQGNDFLDGGPGNDLIDGGTGANILVFFQGGGQDIYRAPASTEFSEIRLSFYYNDVPGAPQRGLLSGDTTVTRAGDDLLISVNGSSDSITIENYFAQADLGLYPIREIGFYDETWDNAAIAAHLQTPPTGGTDAGETLTGTPGNDVIFAGAGNDLVTGGAGDDFLNGELGDDLMQGGPGNDTHVVDSPGDQVVELQGEGVDTVQSYIDYRLGQGVENLILIGDIARVGTGNRLDNFLIGNALDNELWGRRGDDVLYGNAGDDFLNGGLGDDQMYGSWGDDTAVVDSPGDMVGEAAGEGTDTVQSYIDFSLPENVENLTLIGPAARSGIGNALDNVILGNVGDNLLDGRGGRDTLAGGPGDDTLVIDDGQEVVDGGPGTDTLQFGPALTFLDLQGKAGFSLHGIETISLSNGRAADTLRLNASQVLALAPDTRLLHVDGDAGDVLQLGPDWSLAASPQPGYDQYLQTVGGNTAILLVGQALTVSTLPNI